MSSWSEKIIINSDCLEVVQTMHDGGFSATEVSAIYKECVFLARNFSHVIIEQHPRERNIVAHLLAPHVEGIPDLCLDGRSSVIHCM